MPVVLLIEDERIIRENTQEMLEANGYRCITAADGRVGLEIAKKQGPDLIVCDVMLPYLSGFEVKEQLNEVRNRKDIPFIYLTAKSEREDLRRGMDLGAADYITKPFKINELLKSIDRRLFEKKALEEKVNDQVTDMLANFVQIARHECNTPLNAIINLSEFIGESGQDTAECVEELAKCINMSGKRLSKTLNNLIEVISIKHYHNEDISCYKHFDLTHTVERVVSEQAEAFDRLSDVEFELVKIYCDTILEEDFQNMVTELVNNSFKYSLPNSKIHITLKEAGEQRNIELTVSNWAKVRTVFSTEDIRPFKQFKRQVFEQQGSGLGLYLVKLICQRYNGTLEIKCSETGYFTATTIFNRHQDGIRQ
ncbi:response regulator [Mucilaginibacter sp. RS28]|uniref:histidine kinase n=1 Tax=Mucilaginibacter straminoryzae TaxID=2932774 RepID=A0A9X1X213_9SPHI|nr:response regulator [Mucilaginibacter straminoryzae]MCJ8209709.1 response regulator [Mucilaginibacter straminoryzae]